MKLNLAKTIFGASFFVLLFGFQNCSNAKFTSQLDVNALAASGSSGGGDDNNTCRPTSVDSSKIVKVLFLVDTSGSNVSNKTDPNKKWRTMAIEGFVASHASKNNFHYGLITFQGTSTKAHIKAGSTPIFTNNLSAVDSGLSSFKSVVDSGSTPYKAALSAAKKLVKDDLAANASEKASYLVVMISDGQATDYKKSDDVIPDAASIKDLAPDQISLNSIYYYSSSFTESHTKYLRNISTIGGGAFVVANSNQSLNVDDIIRVPSAGCP